jgi:hypothetical protein
MPLPLKERNVMKKHTSVQYHVPGVALKYVSKEPATPAQVADLEAFIVSYYQASSFPLPTAPLPHHPIPIH